MFLTIEKLMTKTDMILIMPNKVDENFAKFNHAKANCSELQRGCNEVVSD